MYELRINNQIHQVDVEEDTPLLWVLRDTLKLTGTKYGCGIEKCGACTVHLNGRAVRSCGIKIGEVVGKDITTIEGLSPTVPIRFSRHGPKWTYPSAATVKRE